MLRWVTEEHKDRLLPSCFLTRSCSSVSLPSFFPFYIPSGISPLSSFSTSSIRPEPSSESQSSVFFFVRFQLLISPSPTHSLLTSRVVKKHCSLPSSHSLLSVQVRVHFHLSACLMHAPNSSAQTLKPQPKLHFH